MPFFYPSGDNFDTESRTRYRVMAQRGNSFFPVCTPYENRDLCRLSDEGETRISSEDEWGNACNCFLWAGATPPAEAWRRPPGAPKAGI